MRRTSLSALALAWLWGAGIACSGDAPGPASDSAGVKAEGAEKIDLEAALERSEFPLLLWAAYSVQEEYFDKSRFDGREQLSWALHDLSLRFPELFAKLVGERIEITVGEASESFSVGELGSPLVVAGVLEQVLIFAKAHLDLEDEEALHRLEYTAINGLLSPLDPHTILLTPEERSDLGVRTKGQFGGIGAEIIQEERRIRVVRVLPTSPAEKAGLKGGDLILQIGDQSTVNMAVSAAQKLLRGPVDTEIIVKIRRDKKALKIAITRQIISIESVLSARLPADVGYLRLITFQENTGEQVATAIREMQSEVPLKAVILDLRRNTGGLLTQAIAVLDLFLSEGELVSVHSAIGRESESAKPETIIGPEVAIVVLIDEEAASASEIVSGTLAVSDRAVILGRRSFGKGTVQMLKPLAPYGRELALKMTIAEYRVAGDQRIQSLGVAPDLVLYPVELSDIQGVARYFDLERFERERERSQVAHLPSARHDPEPVKRPPVAKVLRYLGELRDLSEGEPTELRDPEVAIAREVALALVGIDKKGRNAALRAVQARLADREDSALVARLKAKKIPWQGSLAASGDPKIEVVASITSDGEIKAGAPFDLAVKVTNIGSEPALRLHLLTECVHDELDGIELLIGSLPPGESVRREISLKVMGWHPSFVEDLGLEVHSGEPGEVPDGAAKLRLEVTGLPRSQPTYDYWIVDDPALVAAAPARPEVVGPEIGEPFKVVGNGDGVLQAGERVLLAVRAGNVGVAPAKAVRALLRNKSGAQGLLEEGFHDLGPIKVGGQARGAFGISVAAKPDLAAPLELDLMIADIDLHEAARERLELRLVGERPAYVAGRRRVRIGDEGARLYNGADGKSAVLSELPAGTILQVEGAAGRWLAVIIEPGRRAWVPEDLTSPAGAKAKLRPLPARAVLLVQPPTIELAATPRVVKSATLRIEALLSHPRRLRDVVIGVAPVGPGEVEKKVFFKANAARSGDGARSLAIATEVPLVVGGNRIIITARDGDDVEASREILVYRE